jgi:hypothetical protein
VRMARPGAGCGNPTCRRGAGQSPAVPVVSRLTPINRRRDHGVLQKMILLSFHQASPFARTNCIHRQSLAWSRQAARPTIRSPGLCPQFGNNVAVEQMLLHANSTASRRLNEPRSSTRSSRASFKNQPLQSGTCRLREPAPIGDGYEDRRFHVAPCHDLRSFLQGPMEKLTEVSLAS